MGVETAGAARQVAAMLIQISIQTTQPLTGSASSNGKEPVPFVGWLELLRAVAELADAAEQTVVQVQDLDEGPTTHNGRDRSLS
jgi:hypothetical protein